MTPTDPRPPMDRPFRTRGRRALSATGALALALLGCSDEAPDSAPSAQRGEPVVRTVQDGDVVLVGRVFGKQLAFGERLEAEVEIRAPETVVLREYALGSHAGHLLVRERRIAHDAVADGTRTLRFTCELEARASGTQLVLFPPLAWRAADADAGTAWRPLQLPTIAVEVRAPDAQGVPALDDLEGPGGPLPLPIERRVPRFVPWALGTLGGLAVLAWWLVRRARRRGAPRVAPRDPRDVAREELEALLAQGLVERGEFAAFYYELTRIVRTFVERTTGVRAPELTTEEFLRACERRDDVALFRGESRARLRRFLESADLVKYAAAIPGSGAIDESLSAARAFCGLTSTAAVEEVGA